MGRQLTFDRELQYERQVYGGDVLWLPSVNAEFEGLNGAVKVGRAILDTGSPWCAIPRAIAAGYLGIDVHACERMQIRPFSGPTLSVPYVDIRVRIKSMGVEATCKTLLTDGGPYLIGRKPIFRHATLGFFEEDDGHHNRILVASR